MNCPVHASTVTYSLDIYLLFVIAQSPCAACVPRIDIIASSFPLCSPIIHVLYSIFLSTCFHVVLTLPSLPFQPNRGLGGFSKLAFWTSLCCSCCAFFSCPVLWSQFAFKHKPLSVFPHIGHVIKRALPCAASIVFSERAAMRDAVLGSSRYKRTLKGDKKRF